MRSGEKSLLSLIVELSTGAWLVLVNRILVVSMLSQYTNFSKHQGLPPLRLNILLTRCHPVNCKLKHDIQENVTFKKNTFRL